MVTRVLYVGAFNMCSVSDSITEGALDLNLSHCSLG